MNWQQKWLKCWKVFRWCILIASYTMIAYQHVKLMEMQKKRIQSIIEIYLNGFTPWHSKTRKNERCFEKMKKKKKPHTHSVARKSESDREQIGNKRTMLFKELQSLRLTLGLLLVRLCHQSIFQYQYQYWNFSGAFGARTEQGTEQYTWLLLKSAPF